jgi:hypothetical protein
MDPQRTRPDVTRITSTLAAQHVKACAYIDSLAERIDRLVSAAARREWGQIGHESRELADGSRAAGVPEINGVAQKVCEEAAKPDNEEGVKRSLIRLIGTCGRAGRPEAGASPADGG